MSVVVRSTWVGGGCDVGSRASGGDGGDGEVGSGDGGVGGCDGILLRWFY